jgi:hypothetical protein
MPINAIIKQNNDQMLIDDSWAHLERMIQINSSQGGQFTIYIPAYPGGKGAVQHLSLNMQAAGQGFGATAPGMAGFPVAAPGMGYVSPDELTRRLNDEREKWEMKRKIEDMEAAMESATDWQDILMAKVMDIDPNTIVANLGGFLQQFLQPRSGLQLRGMATEMQPAPDATATPDDTNPAVEEFYYETERLIPALDTIRQHFGSDDDFMTAFEKLAGMFAANPDFFKSQLNK